MDSAIPISAINDFLFCPKSLYLHSVYSSFATNTYHDTPQIQGGIAHENIEKGQYTTSKHVLQGLSVYSERLGVKGKIDIYDMEKGFLIERKYRVKQLYKGFQYQLYAQMYCLEEAGFSVKRLFIQSLSDNKRYEIALPAEKEKQEFEKVIAEMKAFNAIALSNHSCSRCQNNIYGLLNW
jgi:CRISPR-associated protein Cas4